MKIKRLTSTAVIPQYATPGSAAIDLCADINTSFYIAPYDYKIIPTGIAIHIEEAGLVGMIYTRSGNGIGHGVTLRNNVGVIDSDYQGEIAVCLSNDGDSPFFIKPEQRIAQMVFTRIEHVNFDEVLQFDVITERGTGGFGSTGS